MKTLAIIPCTNQKSLVPGPAREVWVGGKFQLTLAHCEMWYSEVQVLSFKYGLISPDMEIEPYNININYAPAGDKLRWWIMVREQLVELAKSEPKYDLISLYVGNSESDRLMRELTRVGIYNVIKPWKGARLGERMQLIYDNVPPWEEEKLLAGEYALPANYGEPKKRGRPSRLELAERAAMVSEDNVEWED